MKVPGAGMTARPGAEQGHPSKRETNAPRQETQRCTVGLGAATWSIPVTQLLCFLTPAVGYSSGFGNCTMWLSCDTCRRLGLGSGIKLPLQGYSLVGEGGLENREKQRGRARAEVHHTSPELRETGSPLVAQGHWEPPRLHLGTPFHREGKGESSGDQSSWFPL